jgi:hypothetical protein
MKLIAGRSAREHHQGNVRHREFEPLGEGYSLRQQSETYAGEFPVENEALNSVNAVFLETKR